MGMFDDIYNTLKNQRYGAGLDRPSGNPIGQWIQGVAQRTMHPLETMASEAERWRKMPIEEMISNVSPGGMLGHTVYHGSPHKFKQFDINKIGTGEGEQAYGHGLYFAENPNVAKSYKRSSSGSLYKVDIPDESISRMLDWDKLLSQQSPEVQSALKAELEIRIPKFEAIYRSHGVPEKK